MSGRGRGRGWYYKQKYGGNRQGGQGHHPHEPGPRTTSSPKRHDEPHLNAPRSNNTITDLQRLLTHIDGRSYPAYKDVQGAWVLHPNGTTLHVDWVQADPYASPSRCRVIVPAAVAAFPPALMSSRVRQTALCDYLCRGFGAAVKASRGDVRAQTGGWKGEKGGEITVDSPGQHVLERSAVIIHPGGAVEARFTVGLPARGRTVLGSWAALVLCTNLPRYIDSALLYENLDAQAVQRHVACVEDNDCLRQALPGLGLVAFVANGSILPRSSGASDAPMSAEAALPFASPPLLAVEVELPNRGRIRGMGIRNGITVICGGGFHGKSTLLEALQAGVYNKIPGDGRELVATDPTAVKIRAEDGRRVAAVDISPFINNLPMGRETVNFSSEDASGSTSQAANIQEALEAGTRVLLIDEDTSASNFMMRDARMRELVAPEKEPITPFVSRIRALSRSGVSSILVVGGTGEYFAPADCVIVMDAYSAVEATAKAHEIADRYLHRVENRNGTHSQVSNGSDEFDEYPPVRHRAVVAMCEGTDAGGVGQGVTDRTHENSHAKLKTRGLQVITVSDEDLDLSGVEQLVEVSQTRAVAAALTWIRGGVFAKRCQNITLTRLLDEIDSILDAEGLDALVCGKHGSVARPRRFEIAAAINRLRSARLQQVEK